MGREATGAVTPRTISKTGMKSTVHTAQNRDPLVCEGGSAGGSLAAGAPVPPALLASWEGWGRIVQAKKNPKQAAEQGEPLFAFFTRSAARFVPGEGLSMPLCPPAHSTARTPAARGRGEEGSLGTISGAGLHGTGRKMPAAFISLLSCCILRLGECFCSRTCSFPLPPLYCAEHRFTREWTGLCCSAGERQQPLSKLYRRLGTQRRHLCNVLLRGAAPKSSAIPKPGTPLHPDYLRCRWGRGRGICSPPGFCPAQPGCSLRR